MAEQLLNAVATAQMLLGDEAVAAAAADAGVSAAYAYPGTPSTEIIETLIAHGSSELRASWCANEKTAYEAALGVSMAGKRALVAMKHVGLNVAADPFMNSAVVAPVGGLVLAVADDPGMHSSQNEQDSRFYAEFARVPCFEPANPQEAYEMTREAFDVSERFRIPVMLRLVTRLAHQRAPVTRRKAHPHNALNVSSNRREWVLLPAFSREQWKKRLAQRDKITHWAASSPYNSLQLNASFRDLGIITTGLARSYYHEVISDLGMLPSHLHVGVYPIPVEDVRRLVNHVGELLVLEEGYPYVERLLRGIVTPPVIVRGRESGDVPADGELSPDLVRTALGLPPKRAVEVDTSWLPGRPPRLCDGCPHIDAYSALDEALAPFDARVVASDIGCYTLGALPPFDTGDSCVCMGASIGMARGASEAGVYPSIAIIGDSTFLHSGITPLMDAVAAKTDMTLLILDNDTTAMTGTQPTLLPSKKLRDIVAGVGVDPAHCHVFESHPKKVSELAKLLREEIEYRGLSVVIVHRECIEAARKAKAARRSEP